MRLPRFHIWTQMVAVALVAVGMWLATWGAWLGIVYAVVVLGLALPLADDSKGGYRLRRDAKQVWLCYLGGVLGPTVCLVFDPFVFRGFIDNSFAQRMPLAPFCYAFMGLSMALLTLWLRVRSARNPWAGLISGALWAGALFAFGVGSMLLPLSVIGLVVLIGALGFTPFATAYVFFTQARRVGERAVEQAEPQRVLTLQVVGAALLVAASVLVQILVSRFSR